MTPSRSVTSCTEWKRRESVLNSNVSPLAQDKWNFMLGSEAQREPLDQKV